MTQRLIYTEVAPAGRLAHRRHLEPGCERVGTREMGDAVLHAL
jgi:hypothetical protein